MKIKFINLDRRKDRLDKMKKNFENLNINCYERYVAIDGKKLVIDSKIEHFFRNNSFGWRRGIMGVALSHYNLWKELVDSNNDYYLILEDDVDIAPNFTLHLENIEKQLNKSPCPFIFLGFHTDKQFVSNPPIIDKNKTVLCELKMKDFIWGGLFGYIIHKNMAKKFVNDIDENGLKLPIDTYVLTHDNLFIAYPLTIKSPFMTFNNFVDSDIQYDLLSVYDDYDFYQGYDSPGNDIKWVPAKTFEELKAIADKEEKCVAFNTYAFLKHHICDPKDFIKIPGSNSKSHGLYVKKNLPVYK